MPSHPEHDPSPGEARHYPLKITATRKASGAVLVEEQEMRYRILGAMEIQAGNRPVRLTAAMQRSVLAILLMAPGRVVRTEEIVTRLWEDPPATATNTVQTLVLRLRRRLDLEWTPDLLRTQPGGYSLAVDPDEVDAHRFSALVHQARCWAAAGRPAAAAAALREALDLWRGTPLADVPAPGLDPFRAYLTEQHLAAFEERIDAELALGRHAPVTEELVAWVTEHPLRERARGQLMLALYRSGRRAEALETYRAGRRMLAGQIGVEPGPDLRRLHAAILGTHPALVTDAPAPRKRADAV
jgi:DNA-binding SARP family transcriptional activator